MKYHGRTVDMPIATAELMLEWLKSCPWRVKYRRLAEIAADIERERETGTYLSGETVYFDSERAAEQFTALFCVG